MAYPKLRSQHTAKGVRKIIVGHVDRTTETRNACYILVGKHRGKRSLLRLINRWEDIIKICLCLRKGEY